MPVCDSLFPSSRLRAGSLVSFVFHGNVVPLAELDLSAVFHYSFTCESLLSGPILKKSISIRS
jgi:hypothetical protein